MPKQTKKRFFTKQLLEWYREHKRKLPWRESNNPYHIWISEVMLQQTRVDTVIPYYYRFLEKFPSIESLADAPEEDVLKAWEGLGYYSRARNLQTAVREVRERYGGIVPKEKDEISSLKGVGPYTAGAILSIAYNKAEPAVDGNVMRVLSRFFFIEEDVSKLSTRRKMEELAKELIPEGAAGDFNQALMELGAMICTPRTFQCHVCPVTEHCSARLEGVVETLPIKKKAKPPRLERRVVAIIRGNGEHEDKVYIRQRPAQGLLASMWEFPHYEVPSDPLSLQGDPHTQEESEMKRLRDYASNEEGLSIYPVAKRMSIEHLFSHIRWDLQVYECELTSDIKPKFLEANQLIRRSEWMSYPEMEQLPFANVFVKIMGELRKDRR